MGGGETERYHPHHGPQSKHSIGGTRPGANAARGHTAPDGRLLLTSCQHVSAVRVGLRGHLAAWPLGRLVAIIWARRSQTPASHVLDVETHVSSGSAGLSMDAAMP